MGLVESVMPAVTLYVPAVVGEPPMAAVFGLKVRPAGSPLTDHVNGVAPPLDARLAEYPTPAMPLGKLVVVMERTGTITSCKRVLTDAAVGLVESTAVMVTDDVPVWLVEPEMMPEVELIDRPAGKPLADQV